MTQQLRTLSVLPEDQGSISSISTWQITIVSNSSSRVSDVHRYVQAKIYILKLNITFKNQFRRASGFGEDGGVS